LFARVHGQQVVGLVFRHRRSDRSDNRAALPDGRISIPFSAIVTVSMIRDDRNDKGHFTHASLGLRNLVLCESSGPTHRRLAQRRGQRLLTYYTPLHPARMILDPSRSW